MQKYVYLRSSAVAVVPSHKESEHFDSKNTVAGLLADVHVIVVCFS